MELLAVYLFGRQLRYERRYRDPLDPLYVSDENLLRHYRLPRHEIISLCQELSPLVQRPTRRAHAIPTHTQVLVTLRFLASGSFQNVIADTTGLHQSSVSRIICHVTHVLYEKARMEIKMPANMVDMNRTSAAFGRIGGFPRVIGAVDGTHIPIKAPHGNEHIYVNRKGFHSLNLQVVCNAELIITSFCIRFPGSTHDSYIWGSTTLRDRFEAGAFRDTHLLEMNTSSFYGKYNVKVDEENESSGKEYMPSEESGESDGFFSLNDDELTSGPKSKSKKRCRVCYEKISMNEGYKIAGAKARRVSTFYPECEGIPHLCITCFAEKH